jgi:A/G-specific adenine glycosylase
MTTRGQLNDEAQQRLLEWYRAGHRELPWRATRDPYHILVSEVMLQQTQADRVVPKYHEFLARFPTLAALAGAPASEVIRAWAGLGYNQRALNLQRLARAVVEQHGGVLPADPRELARLPGIGPYTAGAVACFAFGRDVGFVDTNIRRVLHRVLAGPDVPHPSLLAREIARAAAELVPTGQGYDWNQALMELGATLCRSRTTECERCPLEEACCARPIIQPLLAAQQREPRRAGQRFETSSRFYRGRIVALLRDHPAGLSLGELGRALKPDFSAADRDWIGGYVGRLVRDGLVVPAVAEPGMLREDAPAYDAGASLLDAVYRLPD